MLCSQSVKKLDDTLSNTSQANYTVPWDEEITLLNEEDRSARQKR
jgi:hypothetical protein